MNQICSCGIPSISTVTGRWDRPVGVGGVLVLPRRHSELAGLVPGCRPAVSIRDRMVEKRREGG